MSQGEVSARDDIESDPTPDVDALPSLSAVEPAYQRVLELAANLLEGPVQTRVRTWEDGEFEVYVYHGYGPHAQRPGVSYHHALWFHVKTGEVFEGLVAHDIETGEENLIYKRRVATGGDGDSRAP